MTTKPAATLAKGLRLLAAVLADDGRSTLSAIAGRAGLPLATAHRLALTLEEEGYLSRVRKGYYHRGAALAALPVAANPAAMAAARLRRPLARLASRHRAHVHFGVLDGGMVTYLVKEQGGGPALFTVEQMQLEAYCSAIGKVLLAALPQADFDAYLAAGPFVALTGRTITDPAALRREIAAVRETGVAYDRHEIRDDLFCVGVPVRSECGAIIGGVSASLVDLVPDPAGLNRLQRALEKTAKLAVSA